MAWSKEGERNEDEYLNLPRFSRTFVRFGAMRFRRCRFDTVRKRFDTVLGRHIVETAMINKERLKFDLRQYLPGDKKLKHLGYVLNVVHA